MKLLSFKSFLKKYKFRKTMSESNLQRVYIYPIYPRASKIFSDERFANTDDGSQG